MTGLDVAWMSPPQGVRLQWLAALAVPRVAPSPRTVFENLRSNILMLQLTTQPQSRPEINANLLLTRVVAGMNVKVYTSNQFSSPNLTLAWTRGGTTYTLWVAPTRLLDETPLDIETYVRLVATVRYSDERQG